MHLLASVLRGKYITFQILISYRTCSCFCSWKHSSYWFCLQVFKAKEDFPSEISFYDPTLLPCFLNSVSTLLRSCSNFPVTQTKGMSVTLCDTQFVSQLRHIHSSTKYYYPLLYARHTCMLWITQWTVTDQKKSTLIVLQEPRDLGSHLFLLSVPNLMPSGVLMSGPKPFHITPGKSNGFSCK